jgi:hypothetical protein
VAEIVGRAITVTVFGLFYFMANEKKPYSENTPAVFAAKHKRIQVHILVSRYPESVAA